MHAGGEQIMTPAQVADLAERLRSAVGTVVEGKDETVATATVVLLAGGHLLLEDVPGVGKTLLSRAIARAVQASIRRIQFTPDLFPGDLTGVSVYNQDTHEFTFKPGPVFANLVIGDEINRASPKTQSALLECMEEHTVTADGVTYRLPAPFMVVATQNPPALTGGVDREGTHPLPEAQRDRFMARLSMGYPSPQVEAQLLDHRRTTDPLETVRPVVTVEEVVAAQTAVAGVHAGQAVRDYIVALAVATRRHPGLRLGASPRASLQLLRAAQAWAAAEGRDHVLPDDVQRLARPVLTHRLIPARDGVGEPVAVVDEVLARVPVHRTT